MAFCSLSFVYLFLPMSVLLFYAAPNRFKNAVLLAVSLVFYTLTDAKWLPLMLVSIGFDYAMAALIAKQIKQGNKSMVTVAIVIIKNLDILLFTGIANQLLGTPVPVGLLIYSLTSLGYVVDVYRETVAFEPNIVDFGLFCTFFGKIFTGPLVLYEDFRPYLKQKKPSLTTLSMGVMTFTGGFAKQLILAKGIELVYLQLLGLGPSEVTILSTWSLIISFSFWVYFTLSGFCDMARGLGLLFGMQLPKNFSYPFQSRTVEDFFNRFNITFTQYVRRFVYLTLGGDQGGFASTALNTLLVTMLMGLWFGIRLNFVVWGIYFTVFILIEKFPLRNILGKIPPLFLRIYTFCVVMMSFTVFAGETLWDTFSYLQAMFGFGEVALLNESLLYILSQNYMVILLCFLFATSVLEKLSTPIRKAYPKLTNSISAVVYLLLLLCATSLML